MNSSLTPTDLKWVLTKFPKALRDLMQKQPIFVAGGFIRAVIAREKISDFDIFGPSKEVLNECSLQLHAAHSENGGRARITRTDNAITLVCPPRTPVQFITRWVFPDLKSVVESFDFTVCQAGLWWNPNCAAWESIVSPTFYPDLASRRLVYTAPQRIEDCGGSMMRVRKYLSRGYNIQAESLGAVIARVIKGRPKKNAEGEEFKSFDAMNEVEVARVIAANLREVDPLIIVDGLETVEPEDGTPE